VAFRVLFYKVSWTVIYRVNLYEYIKEKNLSIPLLYGYNLVKNFYLIFNGKNFKRTKKFIY